MILQYQRRAEISAATEYRKVELGLTAAPQPIRVVTLPGSRAGLCR